MPKLLSQNDDAAALAAPVSEGLVAVAREEAVRLRRAGVGTVRDFVEAVSSPTFQGFDKLSAATGITTDRLAELLPAAYFARLEAQLLRKAERAEFNIPEAEPEAEERVGLPARAWRGAKDFASGLIDHLLDVAIAGGVAVALLLVLRGLGAFPELPPPLGLRGKVVVAVRDLKSGRRLRANELGSATLRARRNYFRSADKVEGLMLARDVPALSPLRHEDLLRFQVVAKKDIARCEPLRPEDVELKWKQFEPRALLWAGKASGKVARVAIRADSVLTEDMIKPAPAAGPTNTQGGDSPPQQAEPQC